MKIYWKNKNPAGVIGETVQNVEVKKLLDGNKVVLWNDINPSFLE
jgi:hypothetical protein